MTTVVVRHGNCSSATWQLQFSNMATWQLKRVRTMAIAAGRVVTATRGVWLAGGEGRRPRRGRAGHVLARPDVLVWGDRAAPNVRAVEGCARTPSCGRGCLRATQGARHNYPIHHMCGSYRRPSFIDARMARLIDTHGNFLVKNNIKHALAMLAN